MVIACIVETCRVQYAPTPGNYYSQSARNNISPCRNIDDFNPYNYQDYLAGTNGVDEKPNNCHQTCYNYYNQSGITYLNLTCIDCDNIPQMSHMSVFWQAFQFILIGTSEILAVVTGLEFFYSQSPTVMRSVAQSLNLATNAVGTLLSIPLLLAVNSNPGDEWVPENLDNGHLAYYFLLLAGIMTGGLAYFCFISRNYEYKTTKELAVFEEHRDMDEEDDHLTPLTQAIANEGEEQHGQQRRISDRS
jgi:hypothetical protein